MKFEVLILGSNSALPAHGRHPSSQVVNYDERLFVVDCGEGSQMRMSDFGVKRSRIQAVFISHLHGDHVFGLPGLLTTFILNGRNTDLYVYGPSGIKRFIEVCLNLDQINLPYNLHIIEIDATLHQLVHADEYLEVYSLPLNHRMPTCGYLFCEKEGERKIVTEAIETYALDISCLNEVKKGADGISVDGKSIPNHLITVEPDPPRSYAYCSDTAYHEELLEWIQGVDLLYHEATFKMELQEQAIERYHSTTHDAANIAKLAGAGKLLIGHFSTRYTHLESMLQESKSIFPNTALALEGSSFAV